MERPYVVATNTDYTLIVLAQSDYEAIDIAAEYTYERYNEERDDWVAYEMVDYLNTSDGVWEL